MSYLIVTKSYLSPQTAPILTKWFGTKNEASTFVNSSFKHQITL